MRNNKICRFDYSWPHAIIGIVDAKWEQKQCKMVLHATGSFYLRARAEKTIPSQPKICSQKLTFRYDIIIASTAASAFSTSSCRRGPNAV